MQINVPFKPPVAFFIILLYPIKSLVQLFYHQTKEKKVKNKTKVIAKVCFFLKRSVPEDTQLAKTCPKLDIKVL